MLPSPPATASGRSGNRGTCWPPDADADATDAGDAASWRDVAGFGGFDTAREPGAAPPVAVRDSGGTAAMPAWVWLPPAPAAFARAATNPDGAPHLPQNLVPGGPVKPHMTQNSSRAGGAAACWPPSFSWRRSADTAASPWPDDGAGAPRAATGGVGRAGEYTGVPWPTPDPDAELLVRGRDGLAGGEAEAEAAGSGDRWGRAVAAAVLLGVVAVAAVGRPDGACDVFADTGVATDRGPGAWAWDGLPVVAAELGVSTPLAMRWPSTSGTDAWPADAWPSVGENCGAPPPPPGVKEWPPGSWLGCTGSKWSGGAGWGRSGKPRRMTYTACAMASLVRLARAPQTQDHTAGW